MNNQIKVTRALVSVSDKSGLGEFARGLAGAGVEIYSTGGTRRFLVEQGFSVRDIAEYTGFPEMMDGRVKTLHPKIFGGILWRRDQAEDEQALKEHGIQSFDLVVVNLYPFEQTVAAGRTPRRRSKTSTSAGRRWCARRPRIMRSSPSPRAPSSIRGSWPSYRSAGGGFARLASPVGGRGLRPYGPLRRRHRELVHRLRRRRSWAAGAAEPVVGPEGSAALRRKSAPAGGAICGANGTSPTWWAGGNCTARNSRTTTCWTWIARWPSCRGLAGRPRP